MHRLLIIVAFLWTWNEVIFDLVCRLKMTPSKTYYSVPS